MNDDLPVLSFPSADAWEAWLAEHHASADGVWVKEVERARADGRWDAAYEATAPATGRPSGRGA